MSRRSIPIFVVAGLLALAPPLARAVPAADRTQFVLFSIDNTPSGRRSVESTDFLRLLRAMNRGRPRTPAGLTVFVATGGLVLDPSTAATEATREHLGALPRNRPVIHYATDLPHLLSRAAAVRRMAELGIEIGSHAVRHEHGRGWSRAEWARELREHDRIASRLRLPRARGFRAPFLEHNEHMYDVLRAQGYRYDVSRTTNEVRWPSRHPRTGLWLFPIPTLTFEGLDNRVLLFDDNLRRVLNARARAAGVPAGPARERHVDDAFLAAIREGFERRYQGSRAPFLISGHGGFVAPSVRFLRRTCRRPQVRCATFSEAVGYLEAHPELEGVGE